MSYIGLDLGSAVIRAADERGIRTHRPAREAPAIRRGRVVDDSVLARSLARLTGRTRGRKVALALPAGAPRDGWEHTGEAAREALGARAVVSVPAPVAAIRGARASLRGAVVADLGAELTEVSWAEIHGFYIGASLPWGVRDLRTDLVAHLRARHGVVVDEDALTDEWAGRLVPGRCLHSGADRQVPITTEDVDAILAPRVVAVRGLIQMLERLPGWDAEPDHLVVGGGAMVRDLRAGLLGRARHWCTPGDPTRAVISGLAAH